MRRIDHGTCRHCGQAFLRRRRINHRGHSKPDERVFCSEDCKRLAMWGSTEARFMSSIDKTADGCWLWTGYINVVGYGDMQLAGRRVLAHRLSHEMFKGPIPDGMLVCHHCDVRACVNPDHLFIGTHADNLADMDRKGRRVSVRGEKAPTARLTREQVLEIRARGDAGERWTVIARDYGVTAQTVRMVARRRIWRWLPEGKAA